MHWRKEHDGVECSKWIGSIRNITMIFFESAIFVFRAVIDGCDI